MDEIFEKYCETTIERLNAGKLDIRLDTGGFVVPCDEDVKFIMKKYSHRSDEDKRCLAQAFTLWKANIKWEIENNEFDLLGFCDSILEELLKHLK